jgi:hypothetical protein
MPSNYPSELESCGTNPLPKGDMARGRPAKAPLIFSGRQMTQTVLDAGSVVNLQ